MKKIGLGLLLALLATLLLVGIAAADSPPYFYAGWQDCFPPGCIPPYNYGMYGDWERWAPHNTYNTFNYTNNYTYNDYDYTYNYDYDLNYNTNYGGCDRGGCGYQQPTCDRGWGGCGGYQHQQPTCDRGWGGCGGYQQQRMIDP